jgi:hypothetical protein
LERCVNSLPIISFNMESDSDTSSSKPSFIIDLEETKPIKKVKFISLLEDDPKLYKVSNPKLSNKIKQENIGIKQEVEVNDIPPNQIINKNSFLSKKVQRSAEKTKKMIQVQESQKKEKSKKSKKKDKKKKATQKSEFLVQPDNQIIKSPARLYKEMPNIIEVHTSMNDLINLKDNVCRNLLNGGEQKYGVLEDILCGKGEENNILKEKVISLEEQLNIMKTEINTLKNRKTNENLSLNFSSELNQTMIKLYIATMKMVVKVEGALNFKLDTMCLNCSNPNYYYSTTSPSIPQQPKYNNINSINNTIIPQNLQSILQALCQPQSIPNHNNIMNTNTNSTDNIQNMNREYVLQHNQIMNQKTSNKKNKKNKMEQKNPNIICFTCFQEGHMKAHCPNKT